MPVHDCEEHHDVEQEDEDSTESQADDRDNCTSDWSGSVGSVGSRNFWEEIVEVKLL